MSTLTAQQIRMAVKGPMNADNMNSVLVSLDTIFGRGFGLAAFAGFHWRARLQSSSQLSFSVCSCGNI